MTALLTRLSAHLCNGAPATFRYTAHPNPAQTPWDLVYTADGHRRAIACPGCRDLPADADPETLARAELTHRARRLRLDAAHRREMEASAKREAARHAEAALSLEDLAADLEAP